MICDIYDNVLEEHVAQLIDMEMKEISWKYDYRSHKDGVNKHWHTHGDDLNNISKKTLKAIGQTVMHVIYND